MERIYLDYNQFEPFTPASYFAEEYGFIYFNGQTVFASATESLCDPGGWSADGMRMTVAHTERLYTGRGEAIPAESIPAEVMAYIQRIYAARRRATPPVPVDTNVHLTIGGATYPLWRWQTGASCAYAPSQEERKLLEAHALEAWEQPDGSWYIIDPRYADYGE